MSIKKYIYRCFILIIVSLIHLSCNNYKTSQINKETAAKIFVDSLNKYYPWGNDDDMIVNLELSENNDIIYNHLVHNDSNWIVVNDSLKELIPRFLYFLAHEKSAKIIRDNGISISHKYRNLQNELLYELSFSPSDYLNYKPKEKELIEFLRSKEKHLKIRIPMNLDNGSILIDINYNPPAMLEYKYIIKEIDSKEDSVFFDKSIFVDNLKPEGLIMLDNNILFRYIFYDKNGICLDTINITPDDYQHIKIRL